MSVALSRAGEEEWERLRRLLDWSGSFWLSVLYVDDPAPVPELRQRVLWNRRWAAAPVNLVLAEAPSEVAAAADGLASWPPPPGLTWIEGSLAPGREGDEWEEAWARLFAAMNHRRDTIRGRAGGVVVVVPDRYRALLPRVASDLWSVRGPSPTVDETWSVAPPPPDSAPPDPAPPDPAAALVAREGGSPGGAPLAGAGEELDDELARRASVLLAAPDPDPKEGRALVDDALAANHRQLAAVVLLALARRERDRARARAMLRRALELDGVEARTRLSLLEAVTGDALAVGDLEGAAQAAAESLGIARALASQAATPEARRDLSVSLNNVGRVAVARARWDEAASAYDESLAIRRALASQAATPEARRDLAVSMLNVARARLALGQPGSEELLADAATAAAALDDEELHAAIAGLRAEAATPE